MANEYMTVAITKKTHKKLKDFCDKTGQKVKFIADYIINDFLNKK